MRITTWITAALLAVSLSACGGKLSKDQCQKLVDHMLDLTVKQMGSNASPEMAKQIKDAASAQLGEALDKCVKDGKQAEFDCGMKATSIDEMMKCDN